MINVRWSKRAELDFFEIFSILELDDPINATNFAEKVRGLIYNLSQFPKMGRIVPEIENDRYREVFWKKFRIIYRIQQEFLEIVTIYHGSRLFDL